MQHWYTGANPTPSTDTTQYTMGTMFCPLVNVVIYGIRLFVADDGTASAGARKMTLWNCVTTGSVATKTLPDTLPGYGTWQNFLFDTPANLTGRTFVDKQSCFILSFDTSASGSHHYAALAHVFDAGSTTPDSAVYLPRDGEPYGAGVGNSAWNGAFESPAGGTIPNSSFNATFYGVDLLYDLVLAPLTTGGSLSGSSTLSATGTGSAPSVATGGAITATGTLSATAVVPGQTSGVLTGRSVLTASAVATAPTPPPQPSPPQPSPPLGGMAMPGECEVQDWVIWPSGVITYRWQNEAANNELRRRAATNGNGSGPPVTQSVPGFRVGTAEVGAAAVLGGGGVMVLPATVSGLQPSGELIGWAIEWVNTCGGSWIEPGTLLVPTPAPVYGTGPYGSGSFGGIP